jgi:diketogulonate reductase-like aldo/keto reductase
MGVRAERRGSEIRALQAGIDCGLTLIDTAEMYADGAAETLVGEAIAGRRAEVFLVSKVLPHNASRSGTIAACDRSLRRLRTDCIDLYLLHWPGNHPWEETEAALLDLVQRGKIRDWGVSNFDGSAMTALWQRRPTPACATNQVLYNLSRRGIEWDLLPGAERAGMPLMAYSPLDQAHVLSHPAVASAATALATTPAAVALAWVLRHPTMVTIPKTAVPARVTEFRAALDLVLPSEVLTALERAFPAPTRKTPLEVL